MRMQSVATLIWHSMWLVLIVSWHLSLSVFVEFSCLRLAKLLAWSFMQNDGDLGAAGGGTKCRDCNCAWCNRTSAVAQQGDGEWLSQFWSLRPAGGVFFPRSIWMLQSQHMAGQGNRRDGERLAPGWPCILGENRNHGYSFLHYTLTVYFILAPQWLIVTSDI